MGTFVPVSAAPLTMAGWAYCDQLPSNKGDEMLCLMISDPDGSNWSYFYVRVDDSDDKLMMSTRSTIDDYTSAKATAAITAQTWFHWAGVGISSSSHAAYFNGGNKGTSSDDVTPQGLTQTSIGMWETDGQPKMDYFDGNLAEIGLWNVALTDTEIAILAKGVSPLFIRPQNLVAYWPLVRDDNDRVGGYNMTPYNSPTWAAHAPVIYPAMPQIITVPMVAGESYQRYVEGIL